MKGKIEITYRTKSNHTTDIKIQSGSAKKLLKKYSPVFIIVDRNIAEKYPDLLPAENVFTVEGGEGAKDLVHFGEVIEFLKKNNCRKDDHIVAIGGGTVGDLAGFAAAVYMRGISWSIIPTTLLSMVDSSLGGKTAVNVSGSKNLAGVYHHPDAVAIDPMFLATLPDSAYKAGIGEIIKCAAIGDKDLFSLLTGRYSEIIGKDLDIVEEMIVRACLCKANLVSHDNFDSDRRLLVNVGHTVAHAIEADSGYCISHGEAVVTGLYIETVIGKNLKIIHKKVSPQLAACLMQYGYAVNYIPKSPDEFLARLVLDKKQIKEGLKIPFITKIGKAEISKVSSKEFNKQLRELLTL